MDLLMDNELQELRNIEPKKAWEVDSLESANWALRKIAALDKNNKEIEKLANNERQRIDEWQKKETENNQQTIDFFTEKLSKYYAELLLINPKEQIKTPYGAVTTRKIPAKLEYSENSIEELENKGMSDYIRIKKEPDKTRLKNDLIVTGTGSVFTKDGEKLDSVTAVLEHEKIVIKTN